MPLPEDFENDEEFVRNCVGRSQVPGARFSLLEVEYLYELAGERSPFESTSPKLFMTLPYDEPTTRELLDKASENVYEKEVSRKSDNNVVYLDDYR